MDVSRETTGRLELFSSLLEKWTQHINLIAPSTRSDIWSRHILDSLQLMRHAPYDWRHWADFGSGGGLPGVVVAIVASEFTPARRVTLVESDARKAAFLRTALRECDAKADVVAQRAEDLPSLAADVVSARALAPLPRLLGLVTPHIAKNGIGLFPKGRNVDAEIAEALDRWRFACEKISSDTDAEAVILKIGEIERV